MSASTIDYGWTVIPGFGHLQPMPERYIDPTSREAVFERLEMLRATTGRNEASFARFWGITPQHYDHYKSNKQGLTVAQAHKLAQKMGVTFDFIFRGIWVGLPGELAEKLQEVQEQKIKGSRRS